MNWLRMGAMVLAGALLIGVSAAPAAAGVPTDQLKGAVERVLKTLDDPSLRGNQNDRRVAVRGSPTRSSTSTRSPSGPWPGTGSPSPKPSGPSS